MKNYQEMDGVKSRQEMDGVKRQEEAVDGARRVQIRGLIRLLQQGL